MKRPDNSALVEFLRSIELFASLDVAALDDLTPKLRWEHRHAGETLFRAGEAGESMYVLFSGELSLEAPGESGETCEVRRFVSGECVGEMASLFGGVRTGTIVAVHDCDLIVVEKGQVTDLFTGYPSFRTAAAELIARRMPRLQDATRSLFGELDAATLFELQKEMEWRHLPGGHYLFHQGDDADAMYFVASGRLEVQVQEPAGPVTIAQIGAGEPVGEMALISQRPRSTSVRAVRDTELVRLVQNGFATLLRRHPAARMKVMSCLVDRLHNTTHQSVSRNIATIAVVPLDGSVLVRGFTHRLVEVLQRHGSVMALDADSVDRGCGRGSSQLGLDHLRRVRVTEWLSEQERAHDVLVYEAHPDADNWTMCCVRQADRILLVADGSSDSALRPVEKRFGELAEPRGLPAQHLVLVHDESLRAPANTAAWLDKRTLQDHHHVRGTLPGGYERLGRVMTGTALGLVLGGGGARGLAHLGVLRALEEARIPIDYIGGTSIGAVIAGGYATLGNAREATEAAREGFVVAKPAKAVTLPFTSLIAGSRIDKGLQRQFGDLQIEDLWVRYFCVSCNITRAEIHVHRRHTLWRAVRASLAIPGILPPVFEGGEVFVDGGVLNALPVDFMKQDAGTVIASAAHGEYGQNVDTSLGACPSGFGILARKLNPLRPNFNIPSIAGILMGSLWCSSSQHTKEAMSVADFLIRPPLREFGLLEFDRLDEIADAGYAATVAKIDELTRVIRDRTGSTPVAQPPAT